LLDPDFDIPENIPYLVAYEYSWSRVCGAMPEFATSLREKKAEE
jgi:hypothetical protein